MLWIGLTGGLGSGKSTVAKILRELGYTVVDADEMARLAVGPDSPGLAKVLDQFGTELLSPDRQLDRKKLGQKVFGDAEALAKLEALIHPIVAKLTEERRRAAENRGEKIAFYDVPLLFEKNMGKMFSAVVVVNSALEARLQRGRQRDGLSEEQVKARLGHQIPLEEKVRQADYVIENNGSMADLKRAVDEFLLKLQKPQE